MFEPNVKAVANPASANVESPTIEPFSSRFTGPVTRLLHELPQLYPGGDRWLERRLSDAAAGRARCQLALLRGAVCGVTIEVPKQGRGWKLSTIYISPEYRGRGVGRLLVEHCASFWGEQRITQNIVTVRRDREQALRRLLEPFGFEILDVQVDRYGAGRTEVILQRHQFRKCNRSC
jgi:GNAT superfamily N-acetyltransferase